MKKYSSIETYAKKEKKIATHTSARGYQNIASLHQEEQIKITNIFQDIIKFSKEWELCIKVY